MSTEIVQADATPPARTGTPAIILDALVKAAGLAALDVPDT